MITLALTPMAPGPRSSWLRWHLARPLYARGLSVHLLPYYGPWLWEPIDAGFDLSRSCSTTQFLRAAQAAFEADGQVVPRLGFHSFRKVALRSPPMVVCPRRTFRS